MGVLENLKGSLLYDACRRLRTKKIQPHSEPPHLTISGQTREKEPNEAHATLPAPRASVYYAKSRKRSAIAPRALEALSQKFALPLSDFSKEAFSSEEQN